MAKVLVIDDDPDLLFALVTVLKKKGYEVDFTTKGEETFNKINSFQPQIILLDVLLSGKDGRHICKQIKTTENLKHIPVVMISAHPTAGNSIEEIGADAFIAKPFAVEYLLSKIQEILHSK